MRARARGKSDFTREFGLRGLGDFQTKALGAERCVLKKNRLVVRSRCKRWDYRFSRGDINKTVLMQLQGGGEL